MKKMVLTGMGTEQRFTEDGASDETDYYLVFNNGELRLPTTEEAARQVIKFMYGHSTEDDEDDGDDRDADDREEPEGGNGSYPEMEQIVARAMRESSGLAVSDEDGVDQV